METEIDRPWLTIAEAAERLRRSDITVRKWIKDGVFPPGVIRRPVPGGPYLVDAAALDQWVRTGCFTPTPGEAVA